MTKQTTIVVIGSLRVNLLLLSIIDSSKIICKSANLRGMDKHTGEATESKLFCHPFVKGPTLNRENLLPVGAYSFFLV